jgi:hypothetical protein
VKYESITFKTVLDFDEKIKETPKCFFIVFVQAQNHEFSSELIDSVESCAKYEENFFQLKIEDFPIFHPTQLDK